MTYKLFLFFILLLVYSDDFQSNDKLNEIELRCPPCGCGSDDIIFKTIYVCPSCSMKLIPVNTGLKNKIDSVISKVFVTGILGKLYTKVIYPIFLFGILLSIIFILKNYKKKSFNIFLFAIILTLSLFCFKHQLYGVNYSLTSSYKSIFTPISFVLLIGPFIYFYIKKLLTNSFSWNNIDYLHFVPGILFFLYYFILFISSDEVKNAFLYSDFEVKFSHLEQILGVLLAFAYIYLSIMYFIKWKRNHALNDIILTKWASSFLKVMLSLFIIWALIIFVNYYFYKFGVASVSYNPLFVVIFFVLVWIYIQVFFHPKFFHTNNSITNNNNLIISKSLLESYKVELERLMIEKKVFKEHDLSLADVAKELNINSRHLSLILNKALGKKFYDFVNYYRVEESKKLLKDPNYSNLTIEAIGNLSGFKSKSSFNASFKSYTNKTPKNYKN